jgi:hypothetical protein
VGCELRFNGGGCTKSRIIKNVEVFARHVAHLRGLWRCDSNLLWPWSSAYWRRLQSDWRLPQSAGRSPSLWRCTALHSSRTGDVTDRCHGNGHDGSWKRLNDLPPHPPDQGGRTNDKQGLKCTSSHRRRSDRMPRQYPTKSIRISSSGSIKGRPVWG